MKKMVVEESAKEEKEILGIKREEQAIGKIYYITEASNAVKVENHVLRYWEEELGLPVRRNEQGHRYYTEDDIRLLRKIKRLKDQGLQLKAIKLVLRGMNYLPVEETKSEDKDILYEFGAEPFEQDKCSTVKPLKEQNEGYHKGKDRCSGKELNEPTETVEKEHLKQQVNEETERAICETIKNQIGAKSEPMVYEETDNLVNGTAENLESCALENPGNRVTEKLEAGTIGNLINKTSETLEFSDLEKLGNRVSKKLEPRTLGNSVNTVSGNLELGVKENLMNRTSGNLETGIKEKPKYDEEENQRDKTLEKAEKENIQSRTNDQVQKTRKEYCNKDVDNNRHVYQEGKESDLIVTENTKTGRGGMDKAQKLRLIIKLIVRETLDEYMREYRKEIQEVIAKEMDYQFRMWQEQQDEVYSGYDKKHKGR